MKSYRHESEDFVQRWRTSFAVKISQVVMYAVVFVVMTIAVLYLRNAEERFSREQSADAARLALKITGVLSRTPALSMNELKDPVEQILTDFPFSGVKISLADEDISVGEQSPDFSSLMQSLPVFRRSRDGIEHPVRVEIYFPPVRERFIAHRNRVTLVTLASALAFGLFLTWVILRFTKKPIQTLIGATQSVSDGKLDVRLDTSRTDEFGHLAKFFNQMLDRITQELTERKQAEGALRESEERFRAVFETAQDAIFMKNPDFTYTLANPKMAQFCGVPTEKIIDHTDQEIFGGEVAAELRKADQRVLRGEIVEDECPCPAGKPDGTYHVLKVPMQDSEGNITGLCGIARDITEKRKLEAHMQQAERMEAMGTLAGGIAHDFNNLLMTIQGNVSLMLMELEEEDPFSLKLKNIEQQVRSGAKLTRQLLGYAMKGRYEVKSLDLNSIIEETSEAFGRTRKEISVRRELAPHLSAVEADRGQIEQVLLNLFINAADAMPGGGDLTLRTRNVTDTEIHDPLFRPEPGSYAMLTVTDTGTGMDRKIQEHIFDPFFTTKEIGHGTGLGLASAYGIVKSHKGYISVTSQPGRGTTFTIYFPASAKEVARADEGKTQIIEGTGTILMVDDEITILSVSATLLKTLGYTVLQANSGQAGVETYRANADVIDIVILDMIMPGMGGSETFDRIMEINPGVKVVLSSGYSQDGQAAEIMERGCSGFIQKPFGIRGLSQKIAEVMALPAKNLSRQVSNT